MRSRRRRARGRTRGGVNSFAVLGFWSDFPRKVRSTQHRKTKTKTIGAIGASLGLAQDRRQVSRCGQGAHHPLPLPCDRHQRGPRLVPPRARQTSAKADERPTRSPSSRRTEPTNTSTLANTARSTRHFLQHAQRIRLRRQGDETAAQKKAK